MASYFKDYVKARGLLTDDQYKTVFERSLSTRGGTFYSALLESGFLDEDTVVQTACDFFHYARVGKPFDVPINFDLSFKLGTIDEIIERKQFAVELPGGTAYVLADPEQDNVKSAVTTAFGKTPQFVLITKAEYLVFAQYQLKPKQNAVASANVVAEREDQIGKGSKLSELESTAAQRLLDSLIECAIERRASDLHIRAMGNGERALVLLRVDGKLAPYTELQGNVLENLRNLLRTKCRVGGEQPHAPVEGQISVKYQGKLIDTRVNIVRSVGGYDFVLRFITSKIRSLGELGLSESSQQTFRRMTSFTKGLVLICGPTGSGKTTLLYAGLKEKMEQLKSIYTIEDPVEIRMPGIVQTNVDVERGLTYKKLFKSALRHDPDIVLLGEIRDVDVANDCIQAADTGHLVMSTIHAHDAVASISRLINLGVDPYALGDILAGVVAQRLVRRICPECKEAYELSPDHPWRKAYRLGNGRITLYRGRGCAKCAGTGYFDRVAINEMVVVTSELRDEVQVKAPRSRLERALLKSGFHSYIEDGVDKALAGITTLDELDEFRNDILNSRTEYREEESEA